MSEIVEDLKRMFELGRKSAMADELRIPDENITHRHDILQKYEEKFTPEHLVSEFGWEMGGVKDGTFFISPMIKRETDDSDIQYRIYFMPDPKMMKIDLTVFGKYPMSTYVYCGSIPPTLSEMRIILNSVVGSENSKREK